MQQGANGAPILTLAQLVEANATAITAAISNGWVPTPDDLTNGNLTTMASTSPGPWYCPADDRLFNDSTDITAIMNALAA